MPMIAGLTMEQVREMQIADLSDAKGDFEAGSRTPYSHAIGRFCDVVQGNLPLRAKAKPARKPPIIEPSIYESFFETWRPTA